MTNESFFALALTAGIPPFSGCADPGWLSLPPGAGSPGYTLGVSLMLGLLDSTSALCCGWLAWLSR